LLREVSALEETRRSPFAIVEGRIIVNVQAPTICPMWEWEDYLRTLEGLDLNRTTYICFTDGVIDAKQRQSLSRTVGSKDYRRAIVTSTSTTVAIVTAVSWLSDGARAFLPSKVDAALKYARVDESLRSQVWSTAGSLCDRLQPQDRPAWLPELVEQGLSKS